MTVQNKITPKSAFDITIEDGKLSSVHPQPDEKKVPLHSISKAHTGIVYETYTLKVG